MTHLPGLSYNDLRNTSSVRIEFKNNFLTFLTFLFQAKNKEPKCLLNKLTGNTTTSYGKYQVSEVLAKLLFTGLWRGVSDR